MAGSPPASFRENPEPSSVEDTPDTVDKILELINAPTWSETRLVIERYPELVQDQMDDFLQELAQEQEDAEAAQAIDMHRRLLQQCRVIGMDDAFAEMENPRKTEFFQAIDQDNWTHCVQLCREELRQLSREEDPVRWGSLQYVLGACLFESTEGSRAEALEESVQSLKNALTVYSEGSEEAARTCLFLSRAYVERVFGDRRSNVEAAIAACRRALDFWTRETVPQKWAEATTYLAHAYQQRIEGSPPANIETAMDLYRQALEVQTRQEMPVTWAITMVNLSTVYLSRTVGNRAQNVKDALSCCEQALEELTPEGDPSVWADMMADLGLVYRLMSDGSRAANVEKAIDAYNASLSIHTKEAAPRRWARGMVGLAAAYLDRLLGDRSENVEAAIRSLQQAVEVFERSDMPFDRADAVKDLGNAYRRRFHKNLDESIEKAIEAYQEALSVYERTVDPYRWAALMKLLGDAYRERVEGVRSENIESSIEALRQAVEVFTREDRPQDWASTMTSLGLAYRNRVLGDPSRNINEAISSYMSAIEVQTREAMPVEWATLKMNLGAAYRNRIPKSPEDDENACRVYRQALEVFLPGVFPDDCRLVATGLGDVYFERQRWREAATAYLLAIQAAENLYRMSLLPSSTRAESSTAPYLYHHAAYSLARVGDLEKAMVVLERSRARTLRKVLLRDRVDLEQVGALDSEILRLYEEAVARLQRIEAAELIGGQSILSIYEEARLAQEALSAVVNRIQNLPGHRRFLEEPEIDELVTDSQFRRAFVFLVTTPLGSLVLLAYRASEGVRLKVTWGDDFSNRELRVLLLGEGDGSVMGYLPSQLDDHKSFATSLAHVLPTLGSSLVALIARHVRQLRLSEVVLVPCGLLGLLPIHAAMFLEGGQQRTLLDVCDVIYSPSLLAVREASEVLLGRRSQTARWVGVSGTVRQGEGMGFSRAELEEAASFFPSQSHVEFFDHCSVKRDLLQALPSASYVHFSCHGHFDADDAMSSTLSLIEGDPLTLREVLQERRRFQDARLVVLSACQSGLFEFRRIADEVVGLPAAFLQAGVPGVIGTLWHVDDLSTMLVMAKFYEYHLEGDHEAGLLPMLPYQALRGAQQWLRTVTAAELLRKYRERRDSAATDKLQEHASRVVLRLIFLPPRSRPFADPYHWAPFFFLGA